MKFYYKLMIVVLASFALLLPACKDDCPVEPDPCSVYPEKMEIVLRTYNYLEATVRDERYVSTDDTAFMEGASIVFESNFEYDSTFWQIGSDPVVYTRPKVQIGFRMGQLGQITARCIGFRKINQQCFGTEDDGIDTIYITITLNEPESAPIYGTYRGTNDGESEVIELKIWRRDDRDPIHNTIDEYYGLPDGNTRVKTCRVRHYELFGGGNGVDHHRISNYHLYGRLQSDGNTIKIYWRLLPFGEEEFGQQRIFTGTKIK